MTTRPRPNPRIAAAALLAVLTTGCISSPLPPRLSPDELELARTAYIGGTVAVEPDEHPAYSRSLIRNLSRTGLFERVGDIDEVSDPILIARVERPISGQAVIPLWPAISLGIIPLSVEESFGDHFSLRRPSDDTRAVVDAPFSGTSTMGWLALLQSGSPDYVLGEPEKSEEYRLYLRRLTAAKARELLEQ